MEDNSISKEVVEKNEDVSSDPKYRGVKAIPFIIGNETIERLGTIGTSSNLLVFLTTVFHLNSFTAATIINVFNGTCNFGTLVGAFLSDTYFGRFKTVSFATVSTFLGLLGLTITASIPKLHPPECKGEDSSECDEPTAWQFIFLLGSFVFLIVGSSGIRPCNVAFGADQFNPKTESGKKGMNSYLNIYYFIESLSMMLSLTIVVYVQSNINWGIGLAIPTILMFFACIMFFSGSKIYVKIVPDHSPIKSLVQVVVVAIKKRRLNPPDEPSISLHKHIPSNSIYPKLPYTDQLRFLNKAAIITVDDKINPDGSASYPWRLCSIQQVEEVKCVIKVLPIWFSCVIYFVVLVQMGTTSVFQALQSDRSLNHHTIFKIPAASFNALSMMSMAMSIPIYDRIIVPLARKVTKNKDGITNLQRIGIGFFLGGVAMIISGVVESRRRYIAITQPTIGVEPRKGEISAMSSLWLIPQFSLAGVSEGCIVIGQLELYIKQFPENMRSFGGAFMYCGFALGSYLSSFLASVVYKITENAKSGNWLAEDLNKGKVDYYYYLVAILQFLNFGYFLVCAKWYKYKREEIKGSERKYDIV